jgi:surface polysaccharide O-acyltransferase-like enzyme
MARKERIVELDALRAFAFFAVVYQHVIGVYMRKPGVDEMTAFLYGNLFHLFKFAVPAFVFITGLVLFYNYYDRVNYPGFIRKRFTEIVVPYAIWSLIYMVWRRDVTGWDVSALVSFVKSLVAGTASYHLWFVVMIFQFYLLYPLLLKGFKAAKQRLSGRAAQALAVAAAAFVYSGLMWVSARYLPAHPFRFDVAWLDAYLITCRDRNFLYYSFYFLMGGMVALALPAFRSFLQQRWPYLLIVFAAAYAYIGYELVRDSGGYMVNLNVATSLKPSMFIYTVAQLLLIYLLAVLVTKRNSRWTALFAMIGRNSYGAYLVHALVLTYVMKGLNLWDVTFSSMFGSVIAFLLCSAASIALSYGLAKLPFGALLVGAAEKKRASAPGQADKQWKQAM